MGERLSPRIIVIVLYMTRTSRATLSFGICFADLIHLFESQQLHRLLQVLLQLFELAPMVNLLLLLLIVREVCAGDKVHLK